MRKFLCLLVALLGSAVPAFAQIGAGAVLPSTCTSGGAFYLTTGSVGMYVCTSTDTWTLAGQPAGGAAWGSVTGTLANQTDLQTALNGKQASGTYATGTGTASGTNTGDQTTVSGNAGTATKLATARAINGVNFDGSAAITVTAAGSTLSDTVTVAKGGTGVTTAAQKAFFAGPQAGPDAAPAFRILSAADVPTLNQNTSGSAATWTSARSLAGNSVNGSADVAFSNKVIVQGTTDAGLSAAQFLGALGTGIVKNATTTGVLSIAVAGDFPTLNQNTSGSAATLTTARAINGVNFDGSAAITVPAAGSTLTDVVPVAKGGTGVAVLPAGTMALPANQTGNATATFKMNGLGGNCTITPVATGRVLFNITGSVGNNTTADSVTWKLAYGTGTAPANAAAASGTVLGAVGVFKALTGQLDAPFASIGLATGLALNTAVWYDLQIADITGGTATATAVTCTAVEY